jgi:hypothetical protein
MFLKASDFDQSKYLGAKNLGEVGFRKRFKMKTVTSEEVTKDDKKEMKACVWFYNQDKGLLLNKTNLRTLSGKFGDLMDGWRDKVIGLMVVITDFRGKASPGIRVYIPTPKGGDGYKAPSPPPPQSSQQAAPLSAAVAPQGSAPPQQEEPPLEAYDDDNFDDDQELNDDVDDVG